jgi:hypothetical protein
MAAKKAAMEEVMDEEMHKAEELLPGRTRAILITEEEYQKGNQEGGKLPLVVKNATQKSQSTMARSNSAMRNITIQESPDNNLEINPQTKKLRFVRPELPYCEPTLSKVKVEDLIMAEQELDQVTEQEQNEQHLHMGPGQWSFWDRLIPKPQYDWPYNLHMPDE